VVCTWGPNLNRVQTIHRGLSCFSLMDDKQYRSYNKGVRFVGITHQTLERIFRTLSPLELKVYLFLRMTENKLTGKSWYTQAKIADKICASRQRVSHAISSLEELGYVKKHQVNQYRIEIQVLRS